MKRYIIPVTWLSLLMMAITGCLGITLLGPQECDAYSGTYSSTLNISVRDKQTGQPIPNARIHIIRTLFSYYQINLYNCDPKHEIKGEIVSETDINGQFSYSYSYAVISRADHIVLDIDLTADHYDKVKVKVDTKQGVGVNEINLRMLTILNQP